ncbi:adenylosuccinate synthetase [Desulfovibrio sp. QI0434]
MPVTVVVGGQFGSEGKGKVAHYLAKEMSATFAVRCGGSNSGHTVIDEHGKIKIFQQLPTASILPDIKLALCAGSYIDVDILLAEIAMAKISPDRLFVDPDAVIITNEMKKREQLGGLIESIGSTGSGTGAAVAARINRETSLVFAKDLPQLKVYVKDVSSQLRAVLNNDERVIVEGTQGFGLSPLHSRFFPKVTSRDTTAAACISEVGLSPLDVDDVVLVIRAFPIRVAGDSGPLENEITWEDVVSEGLHEQRIEEKTTVTKKVRRVARFTPGVVKRAILINRPTKIVLNHADYFMSKNNYKFKHVVASQLCEIEQLVGQKIDLVGIGQREICPRNLFIEE